MNGWVIRQLVMYPLVSEDATRFFTGSALNSVSTAFPSEAALPAARELVLAVARGAGGSEFLLEFDTPKFERCPTQVY